MADTRVMITQEPTGLQRAVDKMLRALCYSFAWFSVLVVLFIVLKIALAAAPAVKQFGFGFLTSRVWDPNQEQYGILPEITGQRCTPRFWHWLLARLLALPPLSS